MNGHAGSSRGQTGGLAPALATVIAWTMILGVQPSPVQAAASVAMALSVQPTLVGQTGTPPTTWTITVTPTGGTVTNLHVSLRVGNGSGAVSGCDPACSISDRTSTATWYPVPDFSTPIQFFGYSYAGGSDITGTVTAGNVPCSPCSANATQYGPDGSLVVQANPANPLTGSVLHVTLRATMNQPLDFSIATHLIGGMDEPTNISPQPFYSAPGVLEWSFSAQTQVTISYDTVVLAAAGTQLFIHSGITGDGLMNIPATDLYVTVGTVATATPLPTSGPKATPQVTATPVAPNATSADVPPADATTNLAESPTTSQSSVPTSEPSIAASVSPSPMPGDAADPPGEPSIPGALLAVGVGGAAAGIWAAAAFFLRRRGRGL